MTLQQQRYSHQHHLGESHRWHQRQRCNTVTGNAILWYGTPITVSRSVTAETAVLNLRSGDPAFGPDGYHLMGVCSH